MFSPTASPNQGTFSPASFGRFVEEKKYLDGVSHRTARNYWDALKAFHRYHTGNEIKEASLKAMAMAMARARIHLICEDQRS
ncbi:MAG TPA: hypothetical protein VHR27_08365 [Blastocatellia bacterium]|jgi:hypothetical protein|nr:hypothetical protein [Blastocatellia bacterium]